MTTIEQAQAAMDEYHAGIRAGGEPVYPQWAADVLARKAIPDWNICLHISELPQVDECIRNFIKDSTEDNAVCLVREILQHAHLLDTVKGE